MWKDVTVVRKKLGRKCTQFGETHVIAFTAFLFQKYRNPMPMTKWQKIWQHDINVKRRIIFTNFMKVKPNVYLGLTLNNFPLKMFDFQSSFFYTHLKFAGLCVHGELVEVHGTHEADPCGNHIQHLSRWSSQIFLGRNFQLEITSCSLDIHSPCSLFRTDNPLKMFFYMKWWNVGILESW